MKWSADGTAVWGDEGDPDIVVTGVKGNAESTYRKGNVNITPENIGALATDGNAVSATKASQDENGDVIVDTYAKKSIYNDTTVSMGRKSGTTVGTGSFAFGYNTTASGYYSHAEGYALTASGYVSHAEGMALRQAVWNLMQKGNFPAQAELIPMQKESTPRQAQFVPM